MIDAKAFGAELAGIVKAAVAPVMARLDALERRMDALPVPVDGKDADPEAVAALVRAEIKADLDALREAVDAFPAPQEAELPDIPAMVTEAVAEAVKTIPLPQDGKDGSSVTVEDVLPALTAQVQKHLDAIPTPQAGKDGRDGANGKDGAPGERGEPGRDGLDVKDLFRAEGGRLVAVMSDGTTKDLGCVVGADGKDGRDGADGKDGADGLGFGDMDFEVKDGRLYAVFRRGAVVKEARLPGISYRGGWKAGEYQTGDSVTHAACQWIATEDTDEKPGEGKAWQLAVRKGRDARGA